MAETSAYIVLQLLCIDCKLCFSSFLLSAQQEKSLNMNAIHINSMLDNKAVGAPVTTSSSSTNNYNSYESGFFRRNSTSNMESMTNGNKYPRQLLHQQQHEGERHHEQGEQVPRPAPTARAPSSCSRSRARRSTPPATRRSSAGPSRKTALASTARSASLRTATTS